MAEKKLKPNAGFKDGLYDKCAKFIDKVDIVLDKIEDELKDIIEEAKEILQDGIDALFNLAAALVIWYDKTAEFVEWLIITTMVTLARKIHDYRVRMEEHKKEFMRYSICIVLFAVVVIGLFAFVTDYEYAYNGRSLGIVKDQEDVLEVLELVSKELTQEYGSNINIDPETDITFTAVLSYGKEIDDADTVLKRFTYMGDIQTQASAIYADGELIAIVESEKVAQEVLDKVLNRFVDTDDDKYEYVGFAEEIEIKSVNTTLAKITSAKSAYNKIKSGGQEEVTYTAKEGDTYYSICMDLGVTFDELEEMNPGLDEDDYLHIGDTFVVSQEVPLLTVETVEITSYAEKIEYETKYTKSSSYYEGETVVSVEGQNGKAKVTARVTKQNGKTVKKKILSKKTITEPVTEVIIKGTKEKPSTAASGQFIRPVNASVYSGYGWRWGRMHYGIDLSPPTGTPIYAADGGTVTQAGWNGAYGLCVTINHGNGFTTLYAHCNSLNVSAGQSVYQGQHIAAVGNTGRSTGPHCHFEIKYNGVNVNPSDYV